MAPASGPGFAGLVAVVAATLGSQTVVSMGVSTLPVIAPRLAASLGVDASRIGFQVSIVYGVAAITALFGSGIVQRLGACRATQLSLLVACLGMAAAAIPRLDAVAVASILLGASMGLVTPPAAHLITRFCPPGRLNLVFSLKQTGVPLGFMLSALTAPAMALGPGWQWSLALVGTLALAWALALQRWQPRWDTDRVPGAALVQSPLDGIRALWIRPPLRRLALTASSFAAVQVCVATFTVTMLVSEQGRGLVAAGLLLSLVNVAGVAARIGWGWASDRRRTARPSLIAIGVMMTFACGGLALLDGGWTWPATTVLFVLVGISAMGWNGILHAEVARLSPAALTGTTASGGAFFVYGAVCLTPAAAAATHAAVESYAALFGLLAGFPLVGVALLAGRRRAAA